MSGGRFNYTQYHLTDIYEHIQSVIDKNGRKKTKKRVKR